MKLLPLLRNLALIIFDPQRIHRIYNIAEDPANT